MKLILILLGISAGTFFCCDCLYDQNHCFGEMEDDITEVLEMVYRDYDSMVELGRKWEKSEAEKDKKNKNKP